MTVDDKTWNMIRDRKRWLEAWIKERGYAIGEKTQEFLYVYYCTIKNVMDTKYARIKTSNINKNFNEPLSDEFLSEKIFYPVENAGAVPKFKNEDIIKRLGITNDEEERLQIGINMKRRKEGEERNKIITAERNKRNRDMMHDYMKTDMDYKELSEKYGLSLQQVKNILRPCSRIKKRERNERILWLKYDWGCNVSEIAEACNCAL